MRVVRFKERLERVYRGHERLCHFLGKAAAGICVLAVIKGQTGYAALLGNPFLLTGLALLYGIFPQSLSLLLTAGLALFQLYSLSVCAAVTGGAVLVILLLLYFGIAEKNDRSFLLTPVFYGVQIPFAAPVVFGLTGSGTSLAGVLFGTIWYYTLNTIQGQAEVLRAAGGSIRRASDVEELITQCSALTDLILRRREMILMLFVCAGVWLVVFVGRQMAVRYAWTMAAGAGALVFAILVPAGSAVLDLPFHAAGFAGGIALAGLVTAVVQLFVFLPDYKGTESVQFEDEDYYYYVRAVPKLRSMDREVQKEAEEPEELSREERRRMRREQHLEQEKETERM